MNHLNEPWKSLVEKMKPPTVGQLAKELGTSPRTLNYWANGERIPSNTAQIAIAALFKKHKLTYYIPCPF